MNKKQYNNVIDWTLTHDQSAQTEDSLKTARTVFKNMGVALPQGDLKQVSDVLKTDDYMGWRSCTMQEAQAAADRGTAAIGINEEKIVILAANDEEQPVTATASVMTLSDTAAENAEPPLAFYSYSYGTTPSNPGGGGTTTSPISFCGGSNYSDVTQHTMVLQNDGYYVCSKCGYRTISPSLQDNLILSSGDYLKVVALSHYYSQMILLADRYPLKAFYYNNYANFAKIVIDTIRSKNEYAQLYAYKGSNGKYHCTETNDTIASFVISSNINELTLGSYNGLYESIAELVLGYYCPEVALLIDITQLVTEESNALDFGSLVASLYGMDDYANVLSIASIVLGMATSEVQIGDRVIDISFNAYSHAEYVFDKDNRIKEVRIFNNF